MNTSQIVEVCPHEGWGFAETVDGALAPAFRVKIKEEKALIGEFSYGWRGKAIDGKYEGANIEMTPRHTEWTEVVVLRVLKFEDRDDFYFYGFANTTGLDCTWL